ncbi:MAG: hypothetical protein EBS55_09160 [Flavobacteriaceae bacterium]|nr:hypothetical protein [Flavobacteriaceae bacterium]
MTIQEAKKVLTIHQEWRLGELKTMIHPQILTDAIDTILSQLPQQEKTLSDKWKEYQDWLNEIPEISDEEIKNGGENAWSDYEYQEGNLYSTTFRDGWLMAIKWYREQLKQKQ